MPPLSPSRLFGELAKNKEIFSRILDDRALSMDAFTRVHTQTISEYQLRYGAHALEYGRAVRVTQELWRYIQALYAGYGSFSNSTEPVEDDQTDNLTHLIYVSAATQELTTEELDKILDSSVRHNTPQAVTGMLLYSGGSFMQVLEGSAAAVDETFSRIVEDPRHTSVVLLHRGPLSERRFQDWTMGFRHLGADDAAAYPHFAPFFQDGFNPCRIVGHTGLALDMLSCLGTGQSS